MADAIFAITAIPLYRLLYYWYQATSRTGPRYWLFYTAILATAVCNVFIAISATDESFFLRQYDSIVVAGASRM